MSMEDEWWGDFTPSFVLLPGWESQLSGTVMPFKGPVRYCMNGKCPFALNRQVQEFVWSSRRTLTLDLLGVR